MDHLARLLLGLPVLALHEEWPHVEADDRPPRVQTVRDQLWIAGLSDDKAVAR
jgi:hypothetical protein